jgi:molybdenum cofactor synthesis domain-containing protein
VSERGQTAAIIVIGDEILSGKYTDENAAYLIKELRELGVALKRIEVIPDVLDDIAATVKATADRFDHVFTSGGVGPTHDDLTMEGIARAFGTRVVRHPELDKLLRAFYGQGIEERNLRMADVPEGAALIEPDGSGGPTWPVVAYRNVYILPGVPVIFRRKFASIRERFRATPFHLRRVYCLGDEGALAVHLDAVVAAHPAVAVGSYPRFDAQDYRVVITIECKDAACADRARDDLVGRLGTVVVRFE